MDKDCSQPKITWAWWARWSTLSRICTWYRRPALNLCISGEICRDHFYDAFNISTSCYKHCCGKSFKVLIFMVSIRFIRCCILFALGEWKWYFTFVKSHSDLPTSISKWWWWTWQRLCKGLWGPYSATLRWNLAF